MINFLCISTSIFQRLGSVLGGQEASKIHPKSIKMCFRSLTSFGIDFSLICFYFDSENGAPELQKSSNNHWFYSIRALSALFKIRSILAPIWVPTCLHVGLQNRRFFEIMAFQEAFKISSFFASIFYRFWVRLGLQHGAILGAKTSPNSKK